jgi:DNA-binding transcriptional LysR family regulator
MTLRELRYLVALANRAHFGRAAEDCHVSQPTLSTQIRKLEDYLGLTLIERNAKSFALTAIGQDVVQKARRIVTEVDALLSSTRTPQGPLSGSLNLGVIPTLAPYFLPQLLPLVKSRYKQLQLVVHEDLTGHLLERLRDYQIDAALLALPLDGEEFEEFPLFDEPFWFACPSRHPLAQSKSVTEADMIGEPMLLAAAPVDTLRKLRRSRWCRPRNSVSRSAKCRVSTLLIWGIFLRSFMRWLRITSGPPGPSLAARRAASRGAPERCRGTADFWQPAAAAGGTPLRSVRRIAGR